MQRLSLGSPASKLFPIHGGGGGAEEEQDDDDDMKKKRKKKGGIEEEKIKAEKPMIRWSSSALAADVTTVRSIHLIPLLTLLCFLVLYLCSHNPSPSDLPGFGGVGRSLDPNASDSGIDQYIGAGSGDVSSSAVVRSHRSLKEAEKRRGRHSRKLGRWKAL